MIKTPKEAKELGYTRITLGPWKHCGVFSTKYFDKKYKLDPQNIYDSTQENLVILEERISRAYNPETQDTKFITEYRIKYDAYDHANGYHTKIKMVDRDLVDFDAIRKDHPELGW